MKEMKRRWNRHFRKYSFFKAAGGGGEMAPAAADFEFIWRCPMSLVRRNKSTQSSFLYHLLHSSLKWNWKIGPQGNSPAGGGWRVDGGVEGDEDS